MKWLSALVLMFSLAACAPGAQPGNTELRPGMTMPELRLVNRSGAPVSLAALRGKAVLVNVWGAWCPPCRAEIPKLIALQDKYRAAGLTVIGVDFGDTRNALETFLKTNPLNYEVWLEDRAQNTTSLRAVLRPWQNLDEDGIAVPYTIAVTREGIVAGTALGYDGSGRELERLVQAALK